MKKILLYCACISVCVVYSSQTRWQKLKSKIKTSLVTDKAVVDDINTFRAQNTTKPQIENLKDLKDDTLKGNESKRYINEQREIIAKKSSWKGLVKNKAQDWKRRASDAVQRAPGAMVEGVKNMPHYVSNKVRNRNNKEQQNVVPEQKSSQVNDMFQDYQERIGRNQNDSPQFQVNRPLDNSAQAGLQMMQPHVPTYTSVKEKVKYFFDKLVPKRFKKHEEYQDSDYF